MYPTGVGALDGNRVGRGFVGGRVGSTGLAVVGADVFTGALEGATVGTSVDAMLGVRVGMIVGAIVAATGASVG